MADKIDDLFRAAFADDDENPVLPGRESVKARQCPHMETRTDKVQRRVYCRRCGSEVDAFTVLQQIAEAPERYIAARDRMNKQAEEARIRLEQLLRLERNARARLKKLDPAAAKAAIPKPWGAG